ncbi:hypothetical protein [Nitrosopumilus sp.]|uniref:hypothetical protein n=1 Tax=Nitrosopumilus sp. TaxID=2024843 RepID=UPI0034A042E1
MTKNNKQIVTSTILFGSMFLTIMLSMSVINNDLAFAASEKEELSKQSIAIDREFLAVEQKLNSVQANLSNENEKMIRAINNGDFESYRDAKDMISSLEVETVTLKNQLSGLQDQLDEIRQQKRNLITIDPVLSDKLNSAHDLLKNKIRETTMLNPNTNVIGGIPISSEFVDLNQEKLVIRIDVKHPIITDSILVAKSDEMTNQFLLAAKEIVGDDVPIDIRYSNISPLSCTSRDSECRPLWGGVEISNDSYLCTLGFRAFDDVYPYSVGFVTAGHCFDSVETAYQPHGGDGVGTADKNTWTGSTFTDCDCAFVDLDNGIGIEDKMYASSDSSYTIAGRHSSSTLSVNDDVRTSAAASDALNYGEITAIDVTNYYDGHWVYHTVEADYWAESGDSGAQ